MLQLSHSKFYIYLCQLFNLLMIYLVQSTDSNSIRRNPNRNNLVIYANIGQTVNISCLFDPSLIIFNLNNDRMENELDEEQPSFQTITFKKHRRHRNLLREHEKKQRLMNTNFLQTTTKRDLADTKRFFLANQQQLPHSPNEDSESDSVKIKNDENRESFKARDDANKYELDWYFLDKKGRMNIISYGDHTINFKYKTFIYTDKNHGQHQLFDSTNTKNAGESLPYSSSALYSQTSSRSTGKYLTYYLNALIESEDDEGVYQCINPDIPDFILRNVTVLIARNNSSKINKFSFLNLMFIKLFLFLLYRHRLVFY